MGFRAGSTIVLLAEKIIKGIQKMTVKEVLDLMNSYSGLTTIAVVVLASLLEVSKIKFYEMIYDADFSGNFFNKFRIIYNFNSI